MFRNIFNFLLDLLAPKDPAVRQIETLGLACFADQRRKGGVHEGTIFLLPYRNPTVRTALIEIKNYPNKRVADAIGQLLFEELRKRDDLDCALVLPIPITAEKKRGRGWNQCELILDGFEKAMKRAGLPARFEPRKDILIKPRENADQVGRGRKERFENLKNCFAVHNPEEVAGRTVIIFDDIITTGATLGDARRALTSAGAGKVICAAIAH